MQEYLESFAQLLHETGDSVHALMVEDAINGSGARVDAFLASNELVGRIRFHCRLRGGRGTFRSPAENRASSHSAWYGTDAIWKRESTDRNVTESLYQVGRGGHLGLS
jgi:hypothetical protein